MIQYNYQLLQSKLYYHFPFHIYKINYLINGSINTISNLQGSLTLNETISGNVSGATGIFVSKIDNKVTLKDITGLFNTLDSISNDAGSITADIDSIEKLWNN